MKLNFDQTQCKSQPDHFYWNKIKINTVFSSLLEYLTVPIIILRVSKSKYFWKPAPKFFFTANPIGPQLVRQPAGHRLLVAGSGRHCPGDFHVYIGGDGPADDGRHFESKREQAEGFIFVSCFTWHPDQTDGTGGLINS